MGLNRALMYLGGGRYSSCVSGIVYLSDKIYVSSHPFCKQSK